MITLDPEEKAIADPPRGDKKNTSSCSCLTIFLVIIVINLLLGPLSMILFKLFQRPNTRRPYSRPPVTSGRQMNPAQSNYRACQGNMKNIATALEMYAADNQGYYPSSMKTLTPNYIKPNSFICPSSGVDTYSPSYASNKAPSLFTFCCQGQNHIDAGAPPDFPRYTSEKGLIRNP